jgi:hypothetical protein
MIPDSPSAPLAVATLADDQEHVFGIGKDPCPPIRAPWIAWRRDPAGEYHHAGYGWSDSEEGAIDSLAGNVVNLLRAQGAVASGVGPVTLHDPRLQAEVDRIHAREAEARARRERELAEAAERYRVDQERRERLREDLRRAKGRMVMVTVPTAQGPESVRAWTLRGLAVHATLWRSGERPPRERRWTVTHIRTGRAFGCRFPSQGAARAFAVRLQDLGDWEHVATVKEAARAVRGKEERLRALLEDPLCA